MGRPRSFDSDQALDRAMRLFWEKGYEGASLAELTRAMGINPPSLYAAFGSKEGLFRAVLDRYAKCRESFFAGVRSAPTARQAVELLFSGIIEKAADPDQPKGCLLVQGGLACRGESGLVAEELAQRRAGIELLLRERFQRALAEGDLRPGTDPTALAAYFSTVIQGMNVQAASGAGRDELAKVAALALGAIPPPQGTG